MRRAVLLAALAALVLQIVPARAGILDFGSDCGTNKSHNYKYGVRKPYDRLLYMDHVNCKSKFMRVTSVDQNYPVQGQSPMGIISFIEVTDNRNDCTGGFVYIKKGGVRQNFVRLKTMSQRNHGMEFSIRIYGN